MTTPRARYDFASESLQIETADEIVCVQRHEVPRGLYNLFERAIEAAKTAMQENHKNPANPREPWVQLTEGEAAIWG